MLLFLVLTGFLKNFLFCFSSFCMHLFVFETSLKAQAGLNIYLNSALNSWSSCLRAPTCWNRRHIPGYPAGTLMLAWSTPWRSYDHWDAPTTDSSSYEEENKVDGCSKYMDAPMTYGSSNRRLAVSSFCVGFRTICKRPSEVDQMASCFASWCHQCCLIGVDGQSPQGFSWLPGKQKTHFSVSTIFLASCKGKSNTVYDCEERPEAPVHFIRKTTGFWKWRGNPAVKHFNWTQREIEVSKLDNTLVT